MKNNDRKEGEVHKIKTDIKMGRHRYIKRDIHGGKYLAGKIGK